MKKHTKDDRARAAKAAKIAKKLLAPRYCLPSARLWHGDASGNVTGTGWAVEVVAKHIADALRGWRPPARKGKKGAVKRDK